MTKLMLVVLGLFVGTCGFELAYPETHIVDQLAEAAQVSLAVWYGYLVGKHATASQR